jgi:membrane protease YdiL (CAAX protease family)
MSNDSSDKSDQKIFISRGPWYGALAGLLIFFGAQIVGGFLIALYPLTRGWSGDQAADWLTGQLGAQLVYLLIVNLLIFGALYMFLKRRKLGFQALGFRKPKWSDPLYSLLALPVYVILLGSVVAIVKYLVPALNIEQAQELGFNGNYGGAQLALIAVALVVLPPLTEETIFRGLIYTSLRQRLAAVSAALVVSLLFAAGHLPEGGEGTLLYIAAIDTFVLSLVLVYLREKTKGLWAPIGLHALKNGIAFVSLFILHVR